MRRRINQLANSSRRLATCPRSRPDPSGVQASPSYGPGAGYDISVAALKTYWPCSPALTLVAPHQGLTSSGVTWLSTDELPTASSLAGADQSENIDDEDFSDFLRRTTCTSILTVHSTGTFHRVLLGHSESYIQTIKRIVKRYSAPISNTDGWSPVLNSTREMDDGDNNPPDGKLFPTPSDFLVLDSLHSIRTGRYPPCPSSSEAHARQHCLCYLSLDGCKLPWADWQGLTADGRRLLITGPTQQSVRARDSFGNTVLHFLAARGGIGSLIRALHIDFCVSLVGAKNAMGQTFLHVVRFDGSVDTPSIVELLNILTARDRSVIYTRDHYGSTFLHTLLTVPGLGHVVEQVAGFYGQDLLTTRDAFGRTVFGNDVPTLRVQQSRPAIREFMGFRSYTDPAADDPELLEAGVLLQVLYHAPKNNRMQDEQGRNALHCLAVASLSYVTKYYHSHTPPGDSSTQPKLDSSTERLNFRFELLEGLLEAGVDPNQRDCHGDTPLMSFVAHLPEDDDWRLTPQILERLIEKGASVHARNRRGETALHVAVRYGRKLAMRTLLNHGANVHVRDTAGRSLLDVIDAKMNCCNSDENIKEYAHYEACRAWLSGKAEAVQSPTLLDEWRWS